MKKRKDIGCVSIIFILIFLFTFFIIPIFLIHYQDKNFEKVTLKCVVLLKYYQPETFTEPERFILWAKDK